MTATSPTTADGLTAGVKSVRDFLGQENIAIPEYQRPYKWTIDNVDDLINDIDLFMASERYRIGTVILHHEDGRLDIVDGQQRFLTLCLLMRALGRLLGDGGAASHPRIPMLSQVQLPETGLAMSQQRLRENYVYILERFSRRSDLDDWARFLLDRCEVVVLTLRNVDEAFQMFDSQNTRGKPLYPTDLLKAFHIREMSSDQAAPELRQAMVQLWEDIPPESINELFADYLFKIKQWANGRPVAYHGFTTSDIHLFKGIRESDPRNAHNRWAMPFLYAKNYTDDFRQENATLIRYGAMAPVAYPFQIDQPVINGETFFMMVRHYYDLGLRCGLFADDRPAEVSLDPALASVVEDLDQYRRQSTHRLVRNLFDCLVLFYVDRFGHQDLGRAVDLMVRYALSLRIQQTQVRRVMISNYALGHPPSDGLLGVNLFAELRQAMRSRDVLRHVVPAPTATRYPELKGFFSTPEIEA